MLRELTSISHSVAGFNRSDTHAQEIRTRNLCQKLAPTHVTKNCAVWLVGCV